MADDKNEKGKGGPEVRRRTFLQAIGLGVVATGLPPGSVETGVSKASVAASIVGGVVKLPPL